MAIRAVALVHIDPSRVKAVLDPGPEQERASISDDRMDVVEGADGNVYFIEAFGDATAFRMRFALGHTEPDVAGTLIAAALGDLMDEHDDPRGVPLYPETYRPKSRCWDEFMDEFGEAFEWVPIDGEDEEEDQPGVDVFQQTDLMSMVSQMQTQMTPQFLEQAMYMAQGLFEQDGMEELREAVKAMVPGVAPRTVSPQGEPVDIATVLREAGRMLEADPSKKKKVRDQLQTKSQRKLKP